MTNPFFVQKLAWAVADIFNEADRENTAKKIGKALNGRDPNFQWDIWCEACAVSQNAKYLRISEEKLLEAIRSISDVRERENLAFMIADSCTGYHGVFNRSRFYRTCVS